MNRLEICFYSKAAYLDEELFSKTEESVFYLSRFIASSADFPS